MVYRTAFSEMPNSADKDGRQRDTPYSYQSVKVRAVPQTVHTCSHRLDGRSAKGLKSARPKWQDLLICEPAKAAENKQLPVVTSHSYILYGLVDELRLDCCMSAQPNPTELDLAAKLRQPELTLIFGPLSLATLACFLA